MLKAVDVHSHLQMGDPGKTSEKKHPLRVLVVSELYYPEDAATAFFITKIAEGLARQFQVHVYCAQPTYHQRHLRCAWKETRNGVQITRCFSTRFDRRRVSLRAINIWSLCASVFVNLMRDTTDADLLVVGTNPPVLPAVCWLVSLLKWARLILRIEDLYPQVLAAAGIVSSASTPYRLLEWLNAQVLARASTVVVLGRDMKARLLADYKAVFADNHKIAVIPNWGEDELLDLPPGKQEALNGLNFSDHFVILFAGNLGRVQDLETIVASAEMLKHDSAVRFLVVGSGFKRAWLEREVAARSLPNITLLGQFPRTEQAKFLAVCDVGLVSLIPSMSGISVPSRSYNLLAAGKPVIALVEADSEIGRLIAEHKVGWRVNPGSASELSAIIATLSRQPDLVAEYGRNARRVVQTEYSFSKVLQMYTALVDSYQQRA